MPMVNVLTQEGLKKHLRYNPETGEFTRLDFVNKRGQRRKGWAAGSLNQNGYSHINLHGICYKAHRLAWLYMTGKWPSDCIDHIDLNRANNTWNNLREANRIQNGQNAKRHSNNKSGYKGVSWCKRRKAWHAQIKINGVKTFIGYFDEPRLAGAAYAAKAAAHHAEFARTE